MPGATPEHVIHGERRFRPQAASIVGRSPKTLQAWEKDGRGPPPYRDGSGRVFYLLDDLEAFIAGKTFRGDHSEAAQPAPAASSR